MNNQEHFQEKYHKLRPPASLQDYYKANTFITVTNELALMLTDEYYNQHDFGFNQNLYDHNLTTGKVVYEHALDKNIILFSGESNLIPLPSIFNSSFNVENAQNDMVEAIKSVANYIRDMKEKCGYVPDNPTVDMFAIDKTSGRVELLPPYKPDNFSSVKQSLEKLKASAQERARGKDELMPVLESFTDANIQK